MKIVPIFVGELDGHPKGLYSISNGSNPEHNAFLSFLEWLEDNEEMTRFFTETHRQKALQYGYYSPTSISDAIDRTRREADTLLAQLEAQHKNGITHLIKFLEEIFKPLDNHAASEQDLQPSKSRGREKNLAKKKKYWIRMFALKLEPGFYIVTGGSIKLFRYMDEDPALNNQKAALLRVKDFLNEEGIFDSDSIEELIIEL